MKRISVNNNKDIYNISYKPEVYVSRKTTIYE